MEYKAMKVDKARVSSQTHWAKKGVRKHIEASERAKYDVERDKRLEENLCPFCFYIHTSRIGGAAITTKPCGVCGKDMTFSSTSTDDVCPECAKEHGICKRCASVVDFDWREMEAFRSKT